jgi:hypothetical protein
MLQTIVESRTTRHNLEYTYHKEYPLQGLALVLTSNLKRKLSILIIPSNKVQQDSCAFKDFEIAIGMIDNGGDTSIGIDLPSQTRGQNK